MNPVVFLIYFIPAALILPGHLALMAQFSLLYYKAGGTSVLCHFNFASFKVFCILNLLFIKRVIFKQLFNLLSMSTSFSYDIKFSRWLKKFTPSIILLSVTISLLTGSRLLNSIGSVSVQI